MVYDVTNYESFEHVEEWLNEVNRHASESTLKLLVGNKADLADDKKVETEEAKKFSDKLNISFLETSAKNATNVEAAFLTMAKQLIEAKELIGNNTKTQPGSVIVSGGDGGGKTSKMCCSLL